MKKILLAEALLRRKELQEKVNVLARVKDEVLHEVVMTRKKVSDDYDDIVAKVPKITANELTACYDWHARQLRLVDAAIQQANWNTQIEVQDSVMDDFKD
jgi:hypothetical protein